VILRTRHPLQTHSHCCNKQPPTSKGEKRLPADGGLAVTCVGEYCQQCITTNRPVVFAVRPPGHAHGAGTAVSSWPECVKASCSTNVLLHDPAKSPDGNFAVPVKNRVV
jgi:hypothetical protein